MEGAPLEESVPSPSNRWDGLASNGDPMGLRSGLEQATTLVPRAVLTLRTLCPRADPPRRSFQIACKP